VAEGRLEAGGRQEALRLDGEGLDAAALTEKEGAGAHWRGRGVPLGLGTEAGAVFGAGGFHAIAVQPVGGERAAEPGADHPAKETIAPRGAAKWQELHGLVIDGVSLADAMAAFAGGVSAGLRGHGGGGRSGGISGCGLGADRGFQARDKELRAKVTSALMYPAVLLSWRWRC
jgi:hypothetical protein